MDETMSYSNLLNKVSSIGLVDPTWYSKEYPDVVKTGIEPIEHYIKYGFYLKRKPSNTFQIENYNVISNLVDLCKLIDSNNNKSISTKSNETKQLKSTTSCRGYFDALSTTELRGWAIDEMQPGKPVQIDVYINDIFLMKIKTDKKRGDLIRKGLPGECAGFTLTFQDGIIKNGSIIDLKFSGTSVSLNKSNRTYKSEYQKNVFSSRYIDALNSQKIRKITVVIPIYNAYEAVEDCLNSLVKTLNNDVQVLMIDDCSPDERISGLLQEFNKKYGFMHVTNKVNLGYTKTVNKAISLSNENDIVLLNSDTVTTHRWLDSLKYVAYSRNQVATVTALSDNSGAFSVPDIGQYNEIKSGLTYEEHARLITQNTSGNNISVPTGNGFCFYIRRDFLNKFGVFDEVKYPIGYGEENDLCMRAFRAGWNNLICDKAFVYHKRSQSFKDDKIKLMEDGARQLRSDYPEYKKLTTRFHDVEFHLLRSNIRSVLQKDSIVLPRALFVISTTTGGTPQTNLDLMRAISHKYSCYLLRCDKSVIYLSKLVDGELHSIEEVQLGVSINALEHRSEEYDIIVADILFKHKIELLHIRHIAWHSLNLPYIAKSMNIPVIYSMHDFYSICPTVTLSNESGEYCAGTCNNKGKDCKIALWEDGEITNLKNNYIYRWREQFKNFLSYCDAVITTDDSAKEQICKIFPHIEEKFHVIPHGRDFIQMYRAEMLDSSPEKIRVIVPGNISVAKGALLIKQIISQDKQNKLEFHFLGKVASELNGVGIHHGTYTRDDIVEKIKEIKPHLGVVLSLWPETFCHTLTEMWAAGTPVLGIELGAVGNRIKNSGAGWLVKSDISAQECKSFIINVLKNHQDYNDKVEKLNLWQESTGATNTTNWMSEQYTSLYKQFLHCQYGSKFMSVVSYE
ncbi:glycosyltransferase [Leclercia adecarboxylata]|uniref:glycosyltransferase n=1 Tax=Leclercia adecarboxylata TaxID=83655 RepID=UPI002029BFAD|nr:glycosyltransferase [Leclercia adecarboxylata]URN99824.1 glycosyltransferase [Leclercia adecarboxylata]